MKRSSSIYYFQCYSYSLFPLSGRLVSAIKNLVSNIVDYAGLFPPAKLPLDEVIENYEQYLSGDFAWMLSRLVLPIAKTADLETNATFAASKHTWKISALIPPVSDSEAFETAIKTISEFNQRHAATGKAKVDNVEVRTPTVELVTETASKIPDDVVAFLEIPHLEDPTAHLAVIASSNKPNLFAKIRTGGMTTDLIPDAADVARFIAACAKQNVGMKATAGLHLPIRGDYRLTYEENADQGTMFGFLNVFIAAAFAFNGEHDPDFLVGVLNERDAGKFDNDDGGISFGGKTVSQEQLKTIRETKLATFGSCSFTEPTSELKDLGWL